jgi:hypothetical protein
MKSSEPVVDSCQSASQVLIEVHSNKEATRRADTSQIPPADMSVRQVHGLLLPKVSSSA